MGNLMVTKQLIEKKVVFDKLVLGNFAPIKEHRKS
jgi:hypothetical protein